MIKTAIATIAAMTLLFAPSQTLHIDHAAPTPLAASYEPSGYPLICDPTLRNVVQFTWIASPDEPVDKIAVEAQLRKIAEQVNWLFWRDADSYREMRLPAWKVTADCKLDIRWSNGLITGTIPPVDGEAKLIQIEDTDRYCGYAYVNVDDEPGPGNMNNWSSLAAVSRQCLGVFVVAHELLHSIGAVQPSSPHSDGHFHATQFDIMGTISADNCGIYDKIDCGNDDYFSLTPGNRFTGRWNSADSIFLVSVPKHLVWLPIHMRCETC